jgi:phosphohistidine phosphatase SixA
MRILFALVLAFLAQQAVATGDEALWQKLGSEPNLVVLMRHTERAGGGSLTWDPSGMCKGEAMLTEGGRAHARRIGEAFRNRGIKPKVVISSPMCRCRDTARLAFKLDPVEDKALREIGSGDSKRATEFERKALSLIAASRGAAPVIFVSHQPNIDLISLELIEYGELLVARSNESGELTVLGELHVR